MKKTFKRWYEKDEYTRAFMNFLRDMDPEKQCEIAVEIIIKASNLIDRDYEKFIDEIAGYDPKEYKRWYDKNPNVHLAVEALRDLDLAQREQLFHEFYPMLVGNDDLEIDLSCSIEGEE